MLKSAATALPGLSIEPVASRSTVQDGVYQRLSEALMNGRLDPGQQLTIASIADMCGTSHMPVREALRRLAAEGALEVASTGSAHVPAASRGRLDDLCEARVINEGAAGAKAAANASPVMIRRLEAIMADYFEAAREHDLAGMTTRNQEFHFTIYRAAHSPVLLRVIETLWLQFGPFLRLLTRHVEPLVQPLERDSYTTHHYDILEALRAAATPRPWARASAPTSATRGSAAEAVRGVRGDGLNFVSAPSGSHPKSV
jgi:DNA-binding GntR family transcriptional regulator